MKTLIRYALAAFVVAAVFLLYGRGHASDPLAVGVANAAARCPDGFTVEVHGLPAGSTPTSSLSDSCVLALGIPAGAAGAPGTNGVSGYARTATVKSSKSNSSERLAAVAKCPAGKKAIGGGASVTAGRGEAFTITTSQPTPESQGWTARAVKIKSTKSNTSDRTLMVTAICAVVS
jgi:hypothetical protein